MPVNPTRCQVVLFSFLGYISLIISFQPNYFQRLATLRSWLLELLSSHINVLLRET